jgi:selenocysteine-specific elongation factor
MNQSEKMTKKSPSRPARQSAQREELLAKILEFAREQRCLTFHSGTFLQNYGSKFAESEVVRAINYLHSQNKLIRLQDGRFLSFGAIQNIKDKITKQIQIKGSISIGDCLEVFGYGRNRAIPVFDYLDRIGFTRREGDVRVLVNHCPEPKPSKAGE